MKRTKELRILDLFANGYRINRLEAIHSGDTCLNSTVSRLENKYQLSFSRKNERLPSTHGGTVTYTRYWLEGDHLELARSIVQRNKQPPPATRSAN